MAYYSNADLILCPPRVFPIISGTAETKQSLCWPAISLLNIEAKDKEKKSDLYRLVHILLNAYIAYTELGNKATH